MTGHSALILSGFTPVIMLFWHATRVFSVYVYKWISSEDQEVACKAVIDAYYITEIFFIYRKLYDSVLYLLFNE